MHVLQPREVAIEVLARRRPLAAPHVFRQRCKKPDGVLQWMRELSAVSGLNGDQSRRGVLGEAW